MGRQSRLKHERRSDPDLRRRREAEAAERRGNRVLPSLEGFGDAANRTDAVKEALYARHNRRFSRVEALTRELGAPLFSLLVPTYPIDAALTSLGATDDRPPSSYLSEWPDHVRWGLDSAFAAFRMVLAGSALGAAAIVRTQLDRWTANRASTFGVVKRADEGTADYYRRVWSADGAEGDQFGDAWEQLSEALHGRGILLDLVRWEAADVLDGTPDNIRDALSPLGVGMSASLIQVRGCVVSMLEGRGQLTRATSLRALPLAGQGDLTLEHVGPLVWPLDVNLLDGPTPALVRQTAERYRAMRSRTASSGRFPPVRADQLTILGLVEHRSRAFDLAREAFRQEAEQLGPSFDPTQVQLRHQQTVLTAEMAGLTSTWLPPGPSAHALLTAAAAVRPAFWLWLEDDDRALILVRTIIEQTARARTWRLKPAAAEATELRPPLIQRWPEEAGWRRLSIVMRSLGEFAHASPSARWLGALDALAQLPILEPGSASRPEQIARGTTLGHSIVLLAVETAYWLDTLDTGLARVFRDELKLDNGDIDSDIEAWLNRAWAHRSFELGEPVFRAPTPEEFEAVMGVPPESMAEEPEDDPS